MPLSALRDGILPKYLGSGALRARHQDGGAGGGASPPPPPPLHHPRWTASPEVVNSSLATLIMNQAMGAATASATAAARNTTE